MQGCSDHSPGSARNLELPVEMSGAPLRFPETNWGENRLSGRLRFRRVSSCPASLWLRSVRRGRGLQAVGSTNGHRPTLLVGGSIVKALKQFLGLGSVSNRT